MVAKVKLQSECNSAQGVIDAGREILSMPFKPFDELEANFYLYFTISIRMFMLYALDSQPEKVIEAYELM